MIDSLINALPNIILGTLVFLLIYLFARVVRAMMQRASTKTRSHRHLGVVIGRLAFGAILIVGFLLALSIIVPSFKTSDLINILGVGGVAAGFAFKDILQNFLAGILIMLTEPFKIGDQIIVKTFEGTVEDILTRATILKTYDSRRIVIPNAELFTNAVIVNTAYQNRRMQYDVGIGYGDDIALAKKLILATIENLDEVDRDPSPEVYVVGLADSTVNIRVRWWVSPGRVVNTLLSQDKVLTEIKNALVANGIDLPFPTQHVLFHDQTEETDGDRSRQREGWPAGKNSVPQSQKIATSLAELKKKEF